MLGVQTKVRQRWCQKCAQTGAKVSHPFGQKCVKMGKIGGLGRAHFRQKCKKVGKSRKKFEKAGWFWGQTWAFLGKSRVFFG